MKQVSGQDFQQKNCEIIVQLEAQGLEFEKKISVRTLYRYIDMGFIPGMSNKDLPIKHSKDIKKEANAQVRVIT